MDGGNNNNNAAAPDQIPGLPGFTPDMLIRQLQMFHKIAPVMAVKTVNVADLTTGRPIGVEMVTPVFEATKKELQAKIPYDVDRNYDCAWLRDRVLEKIVAAVKKKETTITLENRCCTKDDCPQMIFMKLFVVNLQRAYEAHEDKTKKERK